MANSTPRLSLRMRLAEEKVISTFELKAGETLEKRVKEEIKKANESGLIKGLASRGGLPCAAVFEQGDEENSINSVALFTAEGEEVTDRSSTVILQEGSYLLTGIDGDKQTIIGAIADEDIARRIGSLWRAGLI